MISMRTLLESSSHLYESSHYRCHFQYRKLKAFVNDHRVYMMSSTSQRLTYLYDSRTAVRQKLNLQDSKHDDVFSQLEVRMHIC